MEKRKVLEQKPSITFIMEIVMDRLHVGNTKCGHTQILETFFCLRNNQNRFLSSFGVKTKRFFYHFSVNEMQICNFLRITIANFPMSPSPSYISIPIQILAAAFQRHEKKISFETEVNLCK